MECLTTKALAILAQALIGVPGTLFLILKLTHPHLGRILMAMPARPPEEILADLKADVSCLGRPAALGASGYVTVEDLADRWNTPAEAREHGPGTWNFNAQTSAFTATCLLQAVRVATWQPRRGTACPGDVLIEEKVAPPILSASERAGLPWI